MGLQLTISLLDHSNPQVRIAAATALHDILGDSVAGIRLLTERLVDTSAKVRASGVEAMTYAVTKGNPHVVRAVLGCIKERLLLPEQRQSALQALAKVAKPGDLQVVNTLLLY